MKLLFDQNLSWRLCNALVGSDDITIWTYARNNEFVIVTKDADFHQRSFLLGAPPRVIWIRFGNCSTDQIIELMSSRLNAVSAFERDPDASFLALS